MKILFIFGTRPEAIKLAPVIKAFQIINKFEIKICITAQHREMVDSVLEFFNIKADYDLDIMKPDQSLFDITVNSLKGLENVLNDFNPELLFIQGDTTTVLTGAIAGFYKNIKVAHVEAGLRSGKKHSPYPEEINRILAGHIADYHFVPTEKAKDNLLREGIKNNIWITGNTVIDALFLGLEIIKEQGEKKYSDYFNFINFNRKVFLVTVHRRENFGKSLENICIAIKELLEEYKDIEIIYPVHPNPKVKDTVNRILKGIERIHLINPLDYPYLIWIMSKAYLILTDSGGIQEEAPSLGKPVFVLREVTERSEGIEAGITKLIGVNKNDIIYNIKYIMNNINAYNSMAMIGNPYGDGKSSEKIVEIIMREFL